MRYLLVRCKSQLRRRCWIWGEVLAFKWRFDWCIWLVESWVLLHTWWNHVLSFINYLVKATWIEVAYRVHITGKHWQLWLWSFEWKRKLLLVWIRFITSNYSHSPGFMVVLEWNVIWKWTTVNIAKRIVSHLAIAVVKVVPISILRQFHLQNRCRNGSILESLKMSAILFETLFEWFNLTQRQRFDVFLFNILHLVQYFYFLFYCLIEFLNELVYIVRDLDAFTILHEWLQVLLMLA